MHRFIDQLNVSITTNRTCTLRCDHCYIEPELFKNTNQISIDNYKKIFDLIDDLYVTDKNLKEIEWEVIGGETTMMPFSFWEEMLPWTLERIDLINKKLSMNGGLNFLTNLIYKDKRYTDLFNKYGDNDTFCLYTSWEPDTNRFGSRDQLYSRWKDTLKSISAKNKILDIIFTREVINLGPEYILNEFLPLGITDFSIKMLSPYGSGKSFFEPNMIDFKSMSDFLIEFDKLKPNEITFTPQEEMLGSLHKGTSFQCNGNFKYDLSIEPEGITHFNANQTGSEQTQSFVELSVNDKNWSKKVCFENKEEEYNKITLSHNYCHTCEYQTYCNSGWYHYKLLDESVVSNYDSDECPGYKNFWDYNKAKIGNRYDQLKITHIKEKIAFLKAKKEKKKNNIFLSDISQNYEQFFDSINGDTHLIIDENLIFGKNIPQLMMFLYDLGCTWELNDGVMITPSEMKIIFYHTANKNWRGFHLSESMLRKMICSNSEYQNKISYILSTNISKDNTPSLSSKDENFIRWCIENSDVLKKIVDPDKSINKEDSMLVEQLRNNILFETL